MIFGFFYVIFVLVGLVIMSNLNYYSIHYTLSGDIIVDEEVFFGMNFLGDFINWSNSSTLVPFLKDNFFFLSIIIF